MEGHNYERAAPSFAKGIPREHLLDSVTTDRDHFTIRTPAEDDDAALCGAIEPHPSQRASWPAFSEFLNSVTSPLILTGDPRAQFQVIGGTGDPAAHIPLGVPLTLETEMFQGYVLTHIKGLQGAAEHPFHGTKWLGRTILQVHISRAFERCTSFQEPTAPDCCYPYCRLLTLSRQLLDRKSRSPVLLDPSISFPCLRITQVVPPLLASVGVRVGPNTK
eukprot:GHRR01012384.1.p1 GENE.GHRR01012384.1~~GHRR01012384.1.p1  ORF type:complete len:219 (+),score=3.99 GHRR01012384.1:766-1422(+)